MDNTRVSSSQHLAQVIARKWELVQVELQGKYSLQRMRTFYAYSIQASWCRILLWCIATPIPSLVVNILLDVPPLAPPSAGRDANYVFWARLSVFAIMIDFWALAQIRYLTPTLGMTQWHVLSTSFVATVTSTINAYTLAGAIAMPVPFLLLTGSPVFAVTTAIMLGLYFGRRLKNDASLREAFNRSGGISGLQLFLMFIYPAFIYGFNSIPSKYQTPYMIIVPVIKILTKNIISRLVGTNDDIKPAEIIFSVDCFNAIYVSLAMQRATAASTSLVVMLIDVLQGCVSVYDVYQGFQPLKRFMAKLPVGHSLHGKNFLEVASALDQEDKLSSLKRQSIGALVSGQKYQMKASKSPNIGMESRAGTKVFIAPQLFAIRRNVNDTSTEKSLNYSEGQAAFLLATRKLLFTTEFVLLVEYTEVIMPVFYSLLMAATYFLPNRAFYSTIADIDEHELWTMVTNVLMYAALELTSLIVLDLVLRRITGVSAMHQVGFVLDRQRMIVQSKLLSWVLYAVQNSLDHFGADYSFQFKWMHSK